MDDTLGEVVMDADSEGEFSEDEDDDRLFHLGEMATDSCTDSTSEDDADDEMYQIQRQERGRGRGREGARTRSRSRVRTRTYTRSRTETDNMYENNDASRVKPSPHPFTGNPGLNVPMQDSKSVYETFQLFVTDDILETMTTETNRYANQYFQRNPAKRTTITWKNWKDVDLGEMKRFLALIFLMGIIKKTDIKSYWSTKPMLATPFFGQTMSRNRFECILIMFHLSDNTAVPAQPVDKLRKVRNLYDHLSQKFETTYTPNGNIAVDESMIPWRGRVSFRQFIPSKPIRYGIKLYLACESGSGYVHRMEMYTGKKDEREIGHGPKVVERLTNDLHGLGYSVFTDSFFSSVELYTNLYKNGVNATGTIRKDRIGLSRELRDKSLNKNEHTEFVRTIDMAGDAEDGSLHTMKIHDKKVVVLLSTEYSSKKVSTGKRDREGNEIKRCQMIHQYNRNMNAVDQFDQNLQSYAFTRKTWKWWKRVAFHLLHMAKVQAYILYNINNPGSKMNQCQFTEELIAILTEDTPPPATFQRRASDPPTRLTEKHFPTKLPATGKKKHPVRNCVVCSKRKADGTGYEVRKATTTECKICDKGLCATPCFEIYHTRKDFKRAATPDN